MLGVPWAKFRNNLMTANLKVNCLSKKDTDWL